MNTAFTIIGLAMFIFIVIFSLKRARGDKIFLKEKQDKIKAYDESLN